MWIFIEALIDTGLGRCEIHWQSRLIFCGIFLKMNRILEIEFLDQLSIVDLNTS